MKSVLSVIKMYSQVLQKTKPQVCFFFLKTFLVNAGTDSCKKLGVTVDT